MVDLRNAHKDPTRKQRPVHIDTPTWARLGEAAQLARMERSVLVSMLVLDDLKLPYASGDDARAFLMSGRVMPEVLTRGRGAVDFVHRSLYMGDEEWKRLEIGGKILGFGRSKMLIVLIWNDLHLPEDPVRFAGRGDTGQGDMLTGSERTDG